MRKCEFIGKVDTVVEFKADDKRGLAEKFKEKNEDIKFFLKDQGDYPVRSHVLEEGEDPDGTCRAVVAWSGEFRAVIFQPGGTDGEALENGRKTLREHMGNIEVCKEAVIGNG